VTRGTDGAVGQDVAGTDNHGQAIV
jgi:hypothetical protein